MNTRNQRACFSWIEQCITLLYPESNSDIIRASSFSNVLKNWMKHKEQLWQSNIKWSRKMMNLFCIHAMVDQLNIFIFFRAFNLVFSSSPNKFPLPYCNIIHCQWPCHWTPKQKIDSSVIIYLNVKKCHFSIVFLSPCTFLNNRSIYLRINNSRKKKWTQYIYRHSHLIADDNLLKQVAIQLCVYALKICENNYYLLWFQ